MRIAAAALRKNRALRGAAAAATIYQAVNSNRAPGAAPLPQALAAVPRMVQATLDGRYTGLPKAKLALMGAGLLYVVSPIELLPEAMLAGLGVVDDAVVLGWVGAALIGETDKFLSWEGRR